MFLSNNPAEGDLAELRTDAPAVVEKIYPKYKVLYQARNWKMFPTIDRVYVNEKARRELGWQPKYDFEHLLDCLDQGKDFPSDLTIAVGAKGYHSKTFDQSPYPVMD